MNSFNESTNDLTGVIFQTWAFKLCGTEHKNGFKLKRPHWSKRFCRLIRIESDLKLVYYHSDASTHNEAERTNKEKGRSEIILNNGYHVQKYFENLNGKEYNLVLNLPYKRLILSFESARILHLFAFYLLSNYRLKDGLEEECFKVRPENTSEHNALGSRGSLCLLHVSPSGIILLLEVSKALLAYWPLVHIKDFCSRGSSQFIITSGRRSMTGDGTYIFNTRLNLNSMIYDRLEKYVENSVNFQQMKAVALTPDVMLNVQMANMQALLKTAEDSSFDNHLSKVSRNIYDKFLEHSGVSNAYASASGSYATLTDMRSLPDPVKGHAVNTNGHSTPSRDTSYASMDNIYIHEEYVGGVRSAEQRKADNPNIYTNTPRQSRSSDEHRANAHSSGEYEVMANGFDSYEASPPYKSTVC
ncbi:DgyrCDS8307 [Dimorphilus gyrociliatus]|uniref:DgyrCDS8307 n=1 Tax=Dimorphilus gyrociliatus TaxID=2664684 RepID=A0A7I8VTQ7_9ANNE|nr:DgyrCDS8307 [Dimorphilus gyrociliatus]